MTSPESLIDRYTKAATSLNKESLLALYTPTMRMFDLMMPWQIRGIEEWGGKVDVWFANIGPNPEVKASDIEVHATDEMALLTLNMDYSHEGDGGERFSIINRLTWVVVPHGDDWRIVHEHTSVPLDETDMTPFFSLE